MPPSLCAMILLVAIFLVPAARAQSISTTAPKPQYPKAKPVMAPMPARLAVPAFVDVVTFDFHADGEHHKVIVTSAPTMLRVDEPLDGYSIIYNPATEHFTGLENLNYQWWEFSWPEVRNAVEVSKRHEERLQELGTDLNAGTAMTDANGPTTDTNAPPATSTSDDGNDSGYVWHPVNEHKVISGIDCVHWIGDTVSGDNIEAWCATGVPPAVEAAVERLRLVNEPMALVPLRTIAPDTIFPVFQALAKGGVTPVLITWGDDQNKNDFRLLSTKQLPGKLSYFTVPKLYIKTTLVTMDGMIPSQPVQESQRIDKSQTGFQNAESMHPTP